MTIRVFALSAVVASALALCAAQAGFDLPIYGFPIRPLRQPVGFSAAPEVRMAFRPAVAITRPAVACFKTQPSSSPTRVDIPPFTVRDAKGGPNLPAGQQDIALYVDSTGALTYAIELRASQPFFQRTPGAMVSPSDSAPNAYVASTDFTVIETDVINRRVRAFNVLRGKYQRGMEGPLVELDSLSSLDHPRARAEAALVLCRRARS
jgi:hypothetical protein